MTTPTSPHVCEEVHPGVVHFIWIATAKKEEVQQQQQTAISTSRSNQNTYQGPEINLTASEQEYYAEFALDADDDDTEESFGKTDYQSRVDSATSDITFEEVFNALVACGKIWKSERPISSWKGDSNKFMCPDPSHDNPGDSTSSAWGSTVKGLWNCTKGCGKGRGGGDKFTLASYLFDEWDFHKLANTMARHFRGVTPPELAPPILKVPGQRVGGSGSGDGVSATPAKLSTVSAGLPQPTVAHGTENSVENGSSENDESSKVLLLQQAAEEELSKGNGARNDFYVATVDAVEVADNTTRVLVLGSDDDEPSDPADDIKVPPLPWKQILALEPKQDSFLHTYCAATSADTVPDEFNFFNGLLAVGMALGNKVTSPDQQTLSMNLGVCLVVQSGGGKSRSIRHLTNTLAGADPWNDISGSKIITSANSGQYLVRAFCQSDVLDDGTHVPVPVKGLVHFDELSEMASASSSVGSILKDKIHALLDHNNTVEYASLSMSRLVATQPFASVITSTQTGKLKDIFTKNDATAGFLNRFLFVLGTSKRQIARGRVPVDLTASISTLRMLRVRYHQSASLEWTLEADTYFENVFHNRIEVIKSLDKRDIMTRLDLNIKRLIVIFAANSHASEVQIHHVKMAELLIDYLVKCYGGVIARVVETKSNEMNDWLLRRIAALETKNWAKKQAAWEAQPNQLLPFTSLVAGDYGVKLADLRREYRQKGWDDEDVRRALNALAQANQVTEKQSSGSRGSKTVLYHVAEWN